MTQPLATSLGFLTVLSEGGSHLGGYLLMRFVIPLMPGLAATWLPSVSLLALATSVVMAIAALGWRHVATVTGTTAVILAVVTAGLLLLR